MKIINKVKKLFIKLFTSWLIIISYILMYYYDTTILQQLLFIIYFGSYVYYLCKQYNIFSSQCWNFCKICRKESKQEVLLTIFQKDTNIIIYIYYCINIYYYFIFICILPTPYFILYTNATIANYTDNKVSFKLTMTQQMLHKTFKFT